MRTKERFRVPAHLGANPGENHSLPSEKEHTTQARRAEALGIMLLTCISRGGPASFPGMGELTTKSWWGPASFPPPRNTATPKNLSWTATSLRGLASAPEGCSRPPSPHHHRQLLHQRSLCCPGIPATARAMWLSTTAAPFSQVPVVSTTMGTKTIP